MEYILTVRDKSVIERMRDLHIKLYVPALRQDLVIVNTQMSPEELMAFEGVLHYEEGRIFRLQSEEGVG